MYTVFPVPVAPVACTHHCMSSCLPQKTHQLQLASRLSSASDCRCGTCWDEVHGCFDKLEQQNAGTEDSVTSMHMCTSHAQLLYRTGYRILNTAPHGAHCMRQAHTDMLSAWPATRHCTLSCLDKQLLKPPKLVVAKADSWHACTGGLHTCEQGMVTMSDEQPHEVAVAHCVNGLHNDFIEAQAGWELLGWDCRHPVHPFTAVLIEEVVMHCAILQGRKCALNAAAAKCSHVWRC